MAIRNIQPTDALDHLAEGAHLVDVREMNEWRNGHAAGAIHLPLSNFRAEDVPKGMVLIICAAGSRSLKAAEMLAARGRAVSNVVGGTLAWQAAGLPMAID